MTASDKDATIDDLVARLGLPARSWVVIDHWEADRCAIGIASEANPRRLVYVSTFGKKGGLFDYECEMPPRDLDEAYSPAGGGHDVSFEDLLAVLISHLESSRAR